MKNTMLMLGATALLSASAHAAIQERTVEYKQGDTVLEGYLAYDDAIQGKRPGVLVVHAWMGLSEYEQRRARELAALGYVAFAADIYGKGVRPADRQEAGQQAGKFRANRELLRQRASAGLQVLADNPHVEASKIAAIGYCFGGGAVLELARSGANVVGTVPFHGNLDTPNPDDAKNIKGKVVVMHGAEDPNVNDEQVAAFQKEMRDAKVNYQINAYGGAVHAFTDPRAGDDPSKGAAYNAQADKRSWQAMRDFFAEIFAD